MRKEWSKKNFFTLKIQTANSSIFKREKVLNSFLLASRHFKKQKNKKKPDDLGKLQEGWSQGSKNKLGNRLDSSGSAVDAALHTSQQGGSKLSPLPHTAQRRLMVSAPFAAQTPHRPLKRAGTEGLCFHFTPLSQILGSSRMGPSESITRKTHCLFSSWDSSLYNEKTRRKSQRPASCRPIYDTG